jgi:chaperonin GroEL (HSP60 family)
VNDQANQRCYLENPLFIIYDGVLNDFSTVEALVGEIGRQWQNAEAEKKNVVIFANGFSDSVINILAYNFPNPNTINVVPMVTPKAGFINAQTHILHDLSAFTGAKVFGLKDKISEAKIIDLGQGMEYFEAYRFRSTIVGSPEELNVQVRVEALKNQRKAPESVAEGMWLDERIGKLTNGIVKLTIFGGSNGELKEAHDRCEDAICAARNAIANGVLEGGCRVTIDLAMEILRTDYPDHVKDVLFPALMAPIQKLLENAGYSDEEIDDKIKALIDNPSMVYDVEKQEFGNAEELGLFDSVGAVEESLKNAVSIATVMGCLGGMVVYPRDSQMEREEAGQDAEFRRIAENPEGFTNEANSRG